MKIIQFIPQLCNEASKSNLSNKHACVALKKGRMITPMFHNYVRSYMCGYKCGTAHAEMVALHHLLFMPYRYRHVIYLPDRPVGYQRSMGYRDGYRWQDVTFMVGSDEVRA